MPAVARGSPWSYGDLLGHANQVAHVLVERLGVVPGNRVLLRGPNNPWLVACWFAVLKAGAVVVTTMPLLRPGELTTVHEIARIDVALCDHRFLDDLRAADLGGAPIIAYGGPAADDLTQVAASYPETFDDVATAADDVALLAFTSGHHRAAEGDHALPPRRARERRHVLPSCAQAHRRRRLHRHPSAGLHVRARWTRRVPASRRRLDAADREGIAGRARRARRATTG